MSTLRCTTLKPWHARCVTHLGKIVENRTTRPPSTVLGQRLAIHAGAIPLVHGDLEFGPMVLPAMYQMPRKELDPFLSLMYSLFRLQDWHRLMHWHFGPRFNSTGVMQGPVSAIVAVATVAGYWTTTAGFDWYCKAGTGVCIGEGYPGFVEPSLWWDRKYFGWHLTDIIILPRPVPCRGAQGIWFVPDGPRAEVMQQMEAR